MFLLNVVESEDLKAILLYCATDVVEDRIHGLHGGAAELVRELNISDGTQLTLVNHSTELFGRPLHLSTTYLFVVQNYGALFDTEGLFMMRQMLNW